MDLIEFGEKLENVKKELVACTLSGNEEMCANQISELQNVVSWLSTQVTELQELINKKLSDLNAHINAEKQRVANMENKIASMMGTGKKVVRETKPVAPPVVVKQPEPPKPQPALELEPEQDNASYEMTDETHWIVAKGKHNKKTSNKEVKKLVGSALKQIPVGIRSEKRYEVAPKVLLPAMVVATPEQCFDNLGKLCWNEVTKKFWFALNGFAIPVSMGRVWKRGDSPIKTSEFDSDKYCRPEYERNYYKPPEKFGGCDQRNFINVIEYCPSAGAAEHSTQLRVADRNNLHTDIKALNDEDARYAVDYASHNLAILLSIYEHFDKL